MNELLTRSWEHLIGRINGPLAFRLILQPVAAIFLAIRSGLSDARLGRPAYGWAMLSDPVHRRDLFREGSKEITKVFVVAVIIDLVYEVIVFHSIYLGQIADRSCSCCVTALCVDPRPQKPDRAALPPWAHHRHAH
jgi:hypothetical protein